MPVPTMLKAALPSIPVVNQLPGIRKDPGSDPSTLGARVREATPLDREHAAAYARVCGFDPRDTLPLTYPHVLAFPLHMELMTDPGFPFAPVGTLHLENSISSHRPLHPGEPLRIEVRASATRPHPKGTVVDFLAEAQVDGEPVWGSTSTYLRLGRGDEQATGGMTFDRTPTATIQWRLPGDLGRRYAAVSGDHNPIHLYPLTAKAFGFPRQIAHGMWSLARCVAALENRLPDLVTVDVAFKKPVPLPGTVGFGHEPVAGGQLFALTRPKDGAPHLVGRAVGG
jgi:acyl dehydratase